MVGSNVNIRNPVFNIMVFIFFLFFAVPFSAHPNEADTNLEYNNGLVSIRESDIPCIKFLIDLSELANLQLIVVETIDPNRLITVNFNHEPIEEVVRSVLYGYNYAVIYNTSEKSQGLLSYKIDKVKNSSDDSRSGLPINAKEAKRQMLIQRIEELNRRIKSGESDRFYSRWAKVKDPKFVVHDRDKLESYQRQLGR